MLKFIKYASIVLAIVVSTFLGVLFYNGAEISNPAFILPIVMVVTLLNLFFCARAEKPYHILGVVVAHMLWAVWLHKTKPDVVGYETVEAHFLACVVIAVLTILSMFGKKIEAEESWS